MAGTEGLVRFKIEPPQTCSGTGNFEEFAKRFTNYMSLSNVRFDAQGGEQSDADTPSET